MKTKTKTSTRSASKAHKGQAAADTNKPKIYEVTFHSTEHSVAKLIVKARSAAEAEEAANEIASETGIDDWKSAYSEMGVESVEPIKGGQDNE